MDQIYEGGEAVGTERGRGGSLFQSAKWAAQRDLPLVRGRETQEEEITDFEDYIWDEWGKTGTAPRMAQAHPLNSATESSNKSPSPPAERSQALPIPQSNLPPSLTAPGSRGQTVPRTEHSATSSFFTAGPVE